MNKINQLKINAQIAKIKSSAIRLRGRYQIPSELSYRISLLTISSSLKEIQYLSEQTKHMLRLPNYYKNYRDIENQYNEVIKEDYQKGEFI